MIPVIAVFAQLLLAVAGYVAACAAVGAFAAATVAASVGPDAVISVAAGTGIRPSPDAIAFGIAAGIGAGVTGFFPGLVAIAFAEAFAIRSLFYYLAVAVPVAVLLAGPDAILSPSVHPAVADVPFLIACGTVAGFTYWLVAGHRAGRWRRTLSAPAPD